MCLFSEMTSTNAVAFLREQASLRKELKAEFEILFPSDNLDPSKNWNNNFYTEDELAFWGKLLEYKKQSALFEIARSEDEIVVARQKAILVQIEGAIARVNQKNFGFNRSGNFLNPKVLFGLPYLFDVNVLAA